MEGTAFGPELLLLPVLPPLCLLCATAAPQACNVHHRRAICAICPTAVVLILCCCQISLNLYFAGIVACSRRLCMHVLLSVLLTKTFCT